MQKRVALARGHMMALGVSLEDLRPVGLTAAPTEPMLAKRQPDKRDLNERIVATLRATPGMTRPALYAKARAYGWQIDEAVETG